MWLVENMGKLLNLCHGQVKVNSIYSKLFYRFNAIRRFSVWLKGTCTLHSRFKCYYIELWNMLNSSFTFCHSTIYSYLLPAVRVHSHFFFSCFRYVCIERTLLWACWWERTLLWACWWERTRDGGRKRSWCSWTEKQKTPANSRPFQQPLHFFNSTLK